jgi:predicted acyltransferase
MAAPQPATSSRIVSVDAFRGAVIALMVLVNTAGMFAHQYAPLRHAEWHGWTITDTVFPSFLWIVGLSLTLTRRTLSAAHVLRRGAVLFALGLFLYGFPDFNLATWRILGVLQRIAICYVAAAFIYRFAGVRGQAAWIAGLLAAYWALMGTERLDVDNNFAHQIDRAVLGAHNYAHTKTWDPEGIVSTLPAIATALFGVLAGELLKIQRPLPERLVWFFVAGNLLIAAGMMLDTVMPVNKNLWTASFAVLMAGLDFVAYAVFSWAVDGLGWKRFTRPLVILGANAIVIYMASELLETVLTATGARIRIHDALFAPVLPPEAASLAYSVTYVLLMLAIAYELHRRSWFVRV